MRFNKVHWFYETELNGVVVSVQKTENNRLWECFGDAGVSAVGKTREEAVNNYFETNK